MTHPDTATHAHSSPLAGRVGTSRADEAPAPARDFYSVAAEAALSNSSLGQRGTYSPVISTASTTCRHTVDREHWHREYLRLRKIGDRKGAKHAHARCMAATCALLGAPS